MQYRETSERIDNIELKNVELQGENQSLKSKLEILEDTHTRERNQLLEELDSLREKEAQLKREIEVLQRHLETAKMAQMVTTGEAAEHQ